MERAVIEGRDRDFISDFLDFKILLCDFLVVKQSLSV